MSVQPLEILKKYWGYEAFRAPQDAIIQSILNGKDTFALLPTGGGKSITFQVPAIMLDGICLVISPLIALMKDQIKNLKNKGIKAEFISSELSYSEIQVIIDNCNYGGINMLYISPERMMSRDFLERLMLLNISFIAIDEAHCISEWGHDFRPAYLELKKIKELFTYKPILALTATATPYIEAEIIRELALVDPQIFRKSLERTNLAYRIRKSEDKLSDLIHILKQNPGATIIFCRTRRQTYELATFLNENGFDADFFHAKLSPEEKSRKQKEFINSNSKILASTNAFGMGIDKPDVRNVIHLSAPDSIESYFQEVGRGGRDGKISRGILLFNEHDKVNAFKTFRSTLPKKKEFLNIIQSLYNEFQIGDHELGQGQKAFSERKFCEIYSFSKPKVRRILQFLEQQQFITIQRSQHQSLAKILIENRHFQDENNVRGRVLSFLARKFAGIFNDPQPIDELLIARQLNLSNLIVKEKLKELHESNTIFYRDAAIIKISFQEPRDDNQARVELYPKFEKLQRIKWQRLNAMYFFIEDENQCKSRMLLRYFGEKITKKCGICSYCQPDDLSAEPNGDAILQFIHSGMKDGEAIFSHFADFDRNKIIKVLQDLVDEDKIKFSLPNNYSL